jgi:hypothetical protein
MNPPAGEEEPRVMIEFDVARMTSPARARAVILSTGVQEARNGAIGMLTEPPGPE